MIEHQTVTANGAAFHVARTGTGKPLLLLHGWPQFWLTWEPVVTRLRRPLHLDRTRSARIRRQ
jgi:pimeloyl-ACP methyl ester carboxylesterase